MTRWRLRSAGSRECGSPTSTLLRATPTPLRPSRFTPVVPLICGYPAVLLLRFTAQAARPRGDLGLLCRCPLPATTGRRMGLPRFLENPLVRAAFSDPGGSHSSGHTRRASCCLCSTHCFGPTTFRSLEALSRGSHVRCLRFEVRVAPANARLAFRSVANLTRTGISPAGLHQEVSATVLTPSLPPPPGFAWRKSRDLRETRERIGLKRRSRFPRRFPWGSFALPEDQRGENFAVSEGRTPPDVLRFRRRFSPGVCVFTRLHRAGE